MEIHRADDLLRLAGRRLGPSQWFEVGQSRVDAFADAADDRHWVHNDPVRAAHGPFGGSISHAHLSLALLPSLVRRILVIADGGSSMFYGYNRVRFPRPVPVGARIRLRGEVLQVDEVASGVQLTLALALEV